MCYIYIHQKIGSRTIYIFAKDFLFVLQIPLISADEIKNMMIFFIQIEIAKGKNIFIFTRIVIFLKMDREVL